MSQLPDTAICRTILADGALATISATRRARANRADVKCSVPGAPALGERMQQVLRLARLTEPSIDMRDQVMLSIDRTPGPAERDWELAAVLADRIVRGLWRPMGETIANGWSEHWQRGQLGGHDLRTPPLPCLLGGELGHLGALNGHPDAAAAVSSARAWFPLHSGGINDSLCWVEVSVFPLAAPLADEESSITVVGLDLSRAAAVRAVLAAARHYDVRGQGRWRSAVRFGQDQFQGPSYELALVMADRIARGREFLPRGRLIASGCSSAWHSGRVDTVEACAAKSELIARHAGPGDRILLPKAWEDELAQGCAAALRRSGASLACIERIGII